MYVTIPLLLHFTCILDEMKSGKVVNPAASFLFAKQSPAPSPVPPSDKVRPQPRSPSAQTLAVSTSAPALDAPGVQHSRLTSLIKDADQDSQAQSARSSVTVSQSNSYQQLNQLGTKSPREAKDSFVVDSASALSPVLSLPAVIESLEAIGRCYSLIHSFLHFYLIRLLPLAEADLDRRQEREREGVREGPVGDNDLTAALVATQINLYTTEEALLCYLAGQYSLGPVPSDM